MITLQDNNYSTLISFGDKNLRTSQRAGKKYKKLKIIFEKFNLGPQFDIAIGNEYAISHGVIFNQNKFSMIAYDMLSKKFGYKKDEEEHNTMYHTILNRIDEAYDTDYASRYLSAIEEKTPTEEGEKIKKRTKKNLFFSILGI